MYCKINLDLFENPSNFMNQRKSNELQYFKKIKDKLNVKSVRKFLNLCMKGHLIKFIIWPVKMKSVINRNENTLEQYLTLCWQKI